MSKIVCCNVRFLGAALLACYAGAALAGTQNREEKDLMISSTEEKISEVNDSITAVSGYEMLDEFEITATKKIISSDGTKLTYNADEDPNAAGKTVLEMLKGVPMISVDAEDNIRINGKDGVKFYLNGKEEPMLSANAKQILKAMPSAAVAKVEVIHEPGAKYDAEGNAGIINLITEREQKTDGYNGSLSASLATSNSDLSAFGMFKHKNLSMSANINYSNSLFMDQKTWSSSETFYKSSGQTLTSNARQNASFNYLGGGFSLSFEPTKLNLFTASANIYNVNARVKNALTADMLTDAQNAVVWQSEKNISGTMKNLGLTANAGYQHTFNNPAHTLILSYQYNFGRSPFDLQHYMLESINLPTTFSRMDQFSHSYNREHTGQLDYSFPFANDKQNLGLGAKAIIRDNTAYSGTSQYDNAENLISESPQDVRQFQDIYAGYATYSATFAERLNLNAGIRYEHTRMGMDFRNAHEQDFTNRLNDVVPNAGLTYVFAPATNLRLAYQMRISRPSLNQVNPFMMETTGFNYQAGNPDLKSEHSNILTLTYTSFGRVVGGNIGIELFNSSNMIQIYQYADGISQITSYANIGSKKSAALTGFLNYQINSVMSVNLNGRLEYGAMDAPSLDYRHNGWNANIHGGWSWRPDKIAQFSVYGGYSTPSLQLQGWNAGWYYYSLNVAKDFLSDKSLKLTVFARNFFQNSMKFKNTAETRDMITKDIYHVRSWAVGASLTWTFGNYQGKVKQLSTSIENDDRSSASTKGQGGL